MSFLKRAIQVARAPGRKVEALVNYLDEYKSSPYEKQSVDKMLYLFESKKDLKDWEVQCDAEVGGKSSAFLETTASGKARFFGNLSSEAPDWLAHSGYTSMMSRENRVKAMYHAAPSQKYTSNIGYHGVETRVRGDGRRYKFAIHQEYIMRVQNEVLFQFNMNTRGGPEYEIFRMPFAKFVRTSRGDIQHQHNPQVDMISSMGFLLADGINGPYQLEVDYIKFIHIPFSEEFDKMDRRKPKTSNLMTYEDL